MAVFDGPKQYELKFFGYEFRVKIFNGSMEIFNHNESDMKLFFHYTKLYELNFPVSGLKLTHLHPIQLSLLYKENASKQSFCEKYNSR